MSQGNISMVQRMKIWIKRFEHSFRNYFSAKGPDLYTRFVRRTFLVLVIAVILAGLTLLAVLWVSSAGASLTKVPSVKSTDVLAAAELIREKGLIIEINGKFDTTIPRYKVIEQYPKQGMTVRKGRIVRLLVSLGRDTYEVPNLVGLTRQKMENLLKDLNIPYDVQVVPVSDDQTNIVIAQSVKPEAVLDRSEKISVVVNDEVNENHAKVRDYTKFQVDTAVKNLYQAGLVPKLQKVLVKEVEKDGSILGQNVAPGNIVEKNSTVILQVGVYGEDDLEKANFQYHIFRYYVPAKYVIVNDGDQQVSQLAEVPVQISVQDGLSDEKELYNKKITSGTSILIVFKSYGATHLFLVVDNQFVREVTYE